MSYWNGTITLYELRLSSPNNCGRFQFIVTAVDEHLVNVLSRTHTIELYVYFWLRKSITSRIIKHGTFIRSPYCNSELKKVIANSIKQTYIWYILPPSITVYYLIWLWFRILIYKYIIQDINIYVCLLFAQMSCRREGLAQAVIMKE